MESYDPFIDDVLDGNLSVLYGVVRNLVQRKCFDDVLTSFYGH